LAQAHILALETEQDGPYNLGNGSGYSVKEVIEVAREVTGHPIPAVKADRRAGDPAKLIAAADKAKDILGWKPEYPDLKDIIASAWQWHQSHPNGYEG
jgi:UDP-glucose 4-epimerase